MSTEPTTRTHLSVLHDRYHVSANAAMCVKGGTKTTEGVIPHKEHDGYVLAVKLDFSGVGDRIDRLKQPLPPLRRNGGYVYALPNGGEWQ